MNIGEAVKTLQIKYPSVSISRIRFLEKEGLISIKRSTGGTRKFTNKDIPRPPHWNGYIVKPNLIEFWQDMPFRLHDRVEYKKVKDDWVTRKLYP